MERSPIFWIVVGVAGSYVFHKYVMPVPGKTAK
jgi:hypothetical protein